MTVSLTAGATAPAGLQANTINTERFFELVDAPKETNDATLIACCKTCRKGKSWGDSCINRSCTRRKGRGCACDGWQAEVVAEIRTSR